MAWQALLVLCILAVWSVQATPAMHRGAAPAKSTLYNKHLWSIRNHVDGDLQRAHKNVQGISKPSTFLGGINVTAEVRLALSSHPKFGDKFMKMMVYEALESDDMLEAVEVSITHLFSLIDCQVVPMARMLMAGLQYKVELELQPGTGGLYDKMEEIMSSAPDVVVWMTPDKLDELDDTVGAVYSAIYGDSVLGFIIDMTVNELNGDFKIYDYIRQLHRSIHESGLLWLSVPDGFADILRMLFEHMGDETVGCDDNLINNVKAALSTGVQDMSARLTSAYTKEELINTLVSAGLADVSVQLADQLMKEYDPEDCIDMKDLHKFAGNIDKALPELTAIITAEDVYSEFIDAREREMEKSVKEKANTFLEANGLIGMLLADVTPDDIDKIVAQHMAWIYENSYPTECHDQMTLDMLLGYLRFLMEKQFVYHDPQVMLNELIKNFDGDLTQLELDQTLTLLNADLFKFNFHYNIDQYYLMGDTAVIPSTTAELLGAVAFQLQFLTLVPVYDIIGKGEKYQGYRPLENMFIHTDRILRHPHYNLQPVEDVVYQLIDMTAAFYYDLYRYGCQLDWSWEEVMFEIDAENILLGLPRRIEEGERLLQEYGLDFLYLPYLSPVERTSEAAERVVNDMYLQGGAVMSLLGNHLDTLLKDELEIPININTWQMFHLTWAVTEAATRTSDIWYPTMTAIDTVARRFSSKLLNLGFEKELVAHIAREVLSESAGIVETALAYYGDHGEDGGDDGSYGSGDDGSYGSGDDGSSESTTQPSSTQPSSTEPSSTQAAVPPTIHSMNAVRALQGHQGALRKMASLLARKDVKDKVLKTTSHQDLEVIAKRIVNLINQRKA